MADVPFQRGPQTTERNDLHYAVSLRNRLVFVLGLNFLFELEPLTVFLRAMNTGGDLFYGYSSCGPFYRLCCVSFSAAWLRQPLGPKTQVVGKLCVASLAALSWHQLAHALLFHRLPAPGGGHSAAGRVKTDREGKKKKKKKKEEQKSFVSVVFYEAKGSQHARCISGWRKM